MAPISCVVLINTKTFQQTEAKAVWCISVAPGFPRIFWLGPTAWMDEPLLGCVLLLDQRIQHRLSLLQLRLQRSEAGGKDFSTASIYSLAVKGGPPGAARIRIATLALLSCSRWRSSAVLMSAFLRGGCTRVQRAGEWSTSAREILFS